MKIITKYFKLKIIPVVISASLVGCGGGGGGGNIIPIEYFDPDEILGYRDLDQQIMPNIFAAWEGGAKGQGVTIAVIDSGINENHVEFQNDLGNSRVDTVNATGFDFNSVNSEVIQVDNYSDTGSDFHGTHVASIAAGQQYGLAPEATILPVNVFQERVFALGIPVTAFSYVAPIAQVVNISIGGVVNPSINSPLFNDTPYYAYMEALSNNDTILVASAGNDSKKIGAEHFEDNRFVRNLGIDPAVQGRVFNVVAVNSDYTVAEFSNTPGSCADVSTTSDIPCDENVMTQIQNTFISAPGVRILAANGLITDGITSLSGTSMAAPVVSGTLAVLLSEWDQLTTTDAAQIVRDTANRSFDGYSPEVYGVGVIDAEAALAPIGVLRSSANSASLTPVTLEQVSAKIPSSLASIKDISALQSVAFYDRYSRDYSINLTDSIYIEKTPINWNAHWNQKILNQYYKNTFSFGKNSLTMAFNPMSPSLLDSLSFLGDGFSLAFGQKGSLVKSLDAIGGTSGFLSGQNLTGNIFSSSFNVSKNIALTGSLDWEDSYSLRENNSDLDTTTQIGLTLKANENISIGAGIEWINQNNSLLDLSGEGTFSFGEKNTTQLNVFSVNYSTGDNSFFGIFKTGSVVNSKASTASYLSVTDLTVGQTLLGFHSKLNPNTTFGIQAFNNLGVTSATINMNIPTGMDKDGNMEYTAQSFKHNGSITPNTVEIFYKVASEKGINYSLNALAGQDDSGLGVRFERRF